MASMMEAIKTRISVRNYNEKTLDEGTRKALEAEIASLPAGPFGSKPKLMLVDATTYSKDELKSLGTYGMIHGAKMYVVGAIRSSAGDAEDFGWSMEKTILAATRLGLGTCFLGGTLNREAFAERMGIEPDERVAGATPVGYPTDGKTFITSMLRWAIRADRRKPFGSMFFSGDARSPLAPEDAGRFLPALDALRIGPSASNKQPWKVIKESGSDTFHFFLDEDKLYNTGIKGMRIQGMDMGIAMCHFETAALELGLGGKWSFAMPDLQAGRWLYTATWKA